MERKIDRNRRLADYIYNDMRSEEVVEIEQEISNDPELSESYRLNMQVKDYLQAKIQLEEMRSDPLLEDAERLADMAFDMEAPTDLKPELISKAPKRSRVRYLAFAVAAAASLTILLAVGILPSNMDGDKMFDRYYLPYDASDYSQRGAAKEMYREVAVGINYYMEGYYTQSIDQLSKLASDPTITSDVQFYTALSFLGLGDYQSAQNILQSSLELANKHQAESLWYLSLCYLKSGEFDNANAVLSQLELYDGLYKKDAQALLKKLRR